MKRVIVATAAIAVSVVLVGTASAALILRFSSTSAGPGATVLVRTAGRPFRTVPRTKPRVFLTDAATAAEVRSPRDRRLRALGALRIDRKGVGRLRFIVPNLPPGDYTTLVYCPTCGRKLVPAGPFRGPFRVTPVLRDCESSVYGELAPGWQDRTVRAGPFALYGVGSYRTQDFEPEREGYGRSVKVLALLDNAARATLVVPPSERSFVSLVNARSLFNRELRVADGHDAVTFEGCPPSEVPHTQFNGGFVVAGPRCARLEVHVRGRAEPFELRVPFGRPC